MQTSRERRRIITTMGVIATCWVIRAIVVTAASDDPNSPQNREAAGFSHDSARVCGDSIQRASPGKCLYYRRPAAYR